MFNFYIFILRIMILLSLLNDIYKRNCEIELCISMRNASHFKNIPKTIFIETSRGLRKSIAKHQIKFIIYYNNSRAQVSSVYKF